MIGVIWELVWVITILFFRGGRGSPTFLVGAGGPPRNGGTAKKSLRRTRLIEETGNGFPAAKTRGTARGDPKARAAGSAHKK